jgi:hypothetical protein
MRHLILVFMFSVYTNNLMACEADLSIRSVAKDGQIIVLDDGSVWEVDSVDTVDSSLWLPTSEIVACDDKLINTDDEETVSARRIR